MEVSRLKENKSTKEKGTIDQRLKISYTFTSKSILKQSIPTLHTNRIKRPTEKTVRVPWTLVYLFISIFSLQFLKIMINTYSIRSLNNNIFTRPRFQYMCRYIFHHSRKKLALYFPCFSITTMTTIERKRPPLPSYEIVLPNWYLI